jgi:hypothetical protein
MFEVVLRRANGRFVKVLATERSRYAAKQTRRYWETKYDQTYDVVVEEKPVK